MKLEQVWVVMMVKDEIDILPFVLDHLIAEEVDGFYIADNMSTDGTSQLLDKYMNQYPNKFHVIHDPEVAYYQRQKMQKWITSAHSLGADIIVPVDADEIWYSRDKTKSLSVALRDMKADVAVARVWDMIPQPTDENTGNPIKDITHREPFHEPFPCVAYRWHPDAVIAQGNHDVSHPGTRDGDTIAIRHFQYRSLEQMKRKFRNGKKAYDATDLDYDMGFHWREGGAKTDEGIGAEWNALVTQPGLLFDPAPVKG
jgi:glycosyltransferase involved in cell wall biosynthesis